MNHHKWDERFLALAQWIAGWSKDPSTKCGAIITRGKHVVSLGFNGFPAGCDDSAILYEDRKLKYPRIIHAEINAILSSKQDLTDCTIYVSPLLPCSRCAAAIIQSGITTVISYTPTPEHTERWGESMKTSKAMFEEAGVKWKTHM
jgi:dCMP deaminase